MRGRGLIRLLTNITELVSDICEMGGREIDIDHRRYSHTHSAMDVMAFPVHSGF